MKIVKNYRYYGFFSFIIILAVFFRFYNLSSVPPSASLDEASIGYNAYSILKTGADEYGEKFPLLLRAYDDWRPALYVYLVIPFVKLLGLTVLAVRLPSAILSVLTVIATNFLVKEIFKNYTMKQFNYVSIALFSSFLLAISPWHIYISRLGHEVNASLSFWIFGLFFLFKGNNENTLLFSRKRVICYFLTALFFAASFGSYQSTKLFIPLIVLILSIIYRKKLFARKKELLLACIIGIFLSLPTIMTILNPNSLVRLKATNVFTAYGSRYYQESIFLKNAKEQHDFLGEVLHNRRILTAIIFLEQYGSHFNPKWLFTNSGRENHKVPGIGLFYPWEIVILFFGITFLIRERVLVQAKGFLILWIAVSVLPAVITTDAPHAMRTFSVLPAPQIIAACGIYYMLSFLKKYQKTLLVLFCLGLIGTIFYFSTQYFVIFPKRESSSFQYALSQTIPFVLSQENRYNTIVFSNKDNLHQSYMFFLFYSKYDPKKYQKGGGTVSGGFAEVHKIGKYHFRSVDLSQEKDSLVIVNTTDLSGNVSPIKTFSNLDGNPVITLVKQ